MAASSTKNMAKHSSYYALGNILRQLVGFIMLPIYTRYLAPGDYGVIGLLTFAIGLIDLAFGARLVQAVPKFYYQLEERKQRYSVISTALLQTSVISVVTVSVLLLFSKEFSYFLLDQESLQLVVALFCVTVLTQAIENYGLLFIRLKQKPLLFLVINMLKLLVQLALNIWLIIFLELGVLGVAISMSVSSLVFALILALYTLLQTGVSYNKKMGIKLIRFSWPLWLAGLAALYVGSSNRYFLKEFASLTEVGLYELATKFSTILPLLIWRPFNMYWQTERFNIYQSNKGNTQVFQSVFWVISSILCLAALGLSIFSGVAIRIMAAPEYYSAANAIPLLSMAAVFACLSTFFNFGYFISEKTIKISVNNYITAIFATLFYFSLIPVLGVVGASAAFCLTSLAQMLLMYYGSRKYFDMNIKLRTVFYMISITAPGYYFAEHVFDFENILLEVAYKLLVFIVFSIFMAVILMRVSYNREYIFNKVPALRKFYRA